MSKRRGDWIDEDEYPDEDDIDRFGDDSPGDYDPRTIGHARGIREPFWTWPRIALAVVVIILLVAFIVPYLSPLLGR